MGYRIKTVAEMTGIPRNTILAWERRYGLVTPERQPNGYREYGDEDVAMLRALKASVDAGQSPSEAISLLRARSANRRTAPPVLADQDLLEQVRAGLTEALIAYDRREADQLFERTSGLSYARQVREILFPVLREIGERWAAGAITVAHEHFASGWCRDQLSAMLLHLESGPVSGPLALCACFPGERHELGLMGLAVLLALDGHRIAWLGADVPLADLCLAAQEQSPALLCVSIVTPVQPHLVLGFAQQLRRAVPARTRILIGGAGVDLARMPELAGVQWAGSDEAVQEREAR